MDMSFLPLRLLFVQLVEPYPFDDSPLRVSVRRKLIPRVVYKSQEEFKEAFARRNGNSLNLHSGQRDHHGCWFVATALSIE